ncbi:Glycine cleavage H-protein [Neofusicoccum parvum]|uniref:Glycine cleavage system H protein n=3 Tax=Neofusicoccum TaxID=407951 RepID=R1G886_BOTPV|nr:putative glycine cleavage system h protein [Neofusicoccum parvum UCRNP2]GME28718.1 Glycine cleavage H-protein [Neofusicoccum parvum]GME44159.1 Glycine cleavage H-protein [Neofusicoccum parvum]
MAARSSIARAARQLASPATRLPRPFVCRSAAAPWSKQSFRPFSASAAIWEKKYTQDHEWVELAADGKTFTLGISSYAANALGDVVFVELPVVDSQFGAHDAIGAVESVKSASDIMTPLPGKVVEVNKALEAKPATINKSPEEEGWIAKLELEEGADPTEGLMSAEDYEKFTEA